MITKFSMYTPVLIYITVLAHACAWEEMINYNRIDSYDRITASQLQEHQY